MRICKYCALREFIYVFINPYFSSNTTSSTCTNSNRLDNYKNPLALYTVKNNNSIDISHTRNERSTNFATTSQVSISFYIRLKTI